MTTLDHLIANSDLSQDLELATAINNLKGNPSDLAAFLANQQGIVYTNIVKQKNDTFNKVYGDLDISNTAQDSLLRYNARNKQLYDLEKNIFDNQKSEADAMVDNKNTFGRKYEMNDWTANNKKDTLFIFSAGFVLLSVLLALTVALRLFVISSTLWAWVGGAAIVIFILTLLNRAQYTEMARSKYYWNKKVFPKINRGVVDICPPPAPVTAPVVAPSV